MNYAKNDADLHNHFEKFIDQILDQIRLVTEKKAARYLFSSLLATQTTAEMEERKKKANQVTSKAQLDETTMEAVAELFHQLRKFEDKVREDMAGVLKEADEAVNAPRDNKEIKLGMRNVEILLAAEKRMCTEIDVKVYESPQMML